MSVRAAFVLLRLLGGAALLIAAAGLVSLPLALALAGVLLIASAIEVRP